MGGSAVVSIIIKWLHLSAAMMWLGATFVTPLVVMRVLQGENRSIQSRFQTNYFISLSPVAWGALSLLALTGAWRAVSHLENGWADLVVTPWGRLLLVKLAVVMLMIVVGAYRTYRLIPLIKKDNQNFDQIVAKIKHTTVISAVLGFVLLWIITLL